MIRNKPADQITTILREIMRKVLPWNSTQAASRGIDLAAERKKDYISHYILRLAYCRSEDLRIWLVRYETLLFKYRWQMLLPEEKIFFLRHAELDVFPISNELKNELADMFQACKGSSFDEEKYYQVPFERVPDLVASREVYLADGYAFVPQSSLISILLSQFKRNLMQALELTARALPRLDDDDRLKPVLKNVSTQYTGKQYGEEAGALSGKVKSDDIDGLSAHFPPCMQHLHEMLRRENHMKHYGRMQYGLFLKGIGLTLDEALIFWRKAFGKITDDAFQKQYAYNIRHNYGQEGKRADYTPYSCIKIIKSNAPSHGDHHGCPFKHFSRDNLAAMLRTHGLEEDSTSEVVELASKNHFQVACTKYFEITRGKFDPHKALGQNSDTTQASLIENTAQHNIMDTIAHPNAFFEKSLESAGIKLQPDENAER